MKTKTLLLPSVGQWHSIPRFCRVAMLTLSLSLAGTFGTRAADDPAVQKLMAEARAKETHAQELRAAAAATLQKAADDQMEASAEERDSRILTAQALKLLRADANKQRAFTLRIGARKLWSEAHLQLVNARNAEQKAAQLSHNADEIRKAAAQLKDQAAIAGTLETEAKESATQAQNEIQLANTDKYSAQSLEERAKAAWAEAEKLDPETHRQVAAGTPRPALAQPRQVK